MSKWITLIILSLFSMVALAASSNVLDENGIPKKPSPPRLVNIIQPNANPFSQSEINALEKSLVDFSKATSTQIVLVVVDNFNGNDKASYATEIGHKWGVGQKGKDNGIVILLKPKEVGNGKGDVFIATGYGLEGVIPDAVAKRIVEYEMIPSFKSKDYFGGIQKSIVVLKSLALKEFTAKQYVDKRSNSGRKKLGLLPFILFIAIFFFLYRRSRSRYYSPGHNVPLWTSLFLARSMSNRGTSWDGFSSGSGGFGGFGGGGFGGGGAGGSW